MGWHFSIYVRNPRQSGHGFRWKAATDSDRKRPPDPDEGGHPVDRVRRGELSAVLTGGRPPFSGHAMGGLMSAARLPMREIREVLRLKYAFGVSGPGVSRFGG